MTEDIQTPQETALTAPKRRKISLTKDERAELARRRDIELAVSYFLDLEQDRTVKEIAALMNTSLATLKRMTQDPYFQEVYDEAMMNLGHHPRLQAMNAQLPDLLPRSFQAMKRLLGPGIAHTAQVGAIKLLWDTIKVGDIMEQEDPVALQNFLAAKGVTINNNVVNINLPEEYRDAFKKFMGGEVVEGQVKDTGTAALETGTQNTDQHSSPEAFPTSETLASSPPGGS